MPLLLWLIRCIVGLTNDEAESEHGRRLVDIDDDDDDNDMEEVCRLVVAQLKPPADGTGTATKATRKE